MIDLQEILANMNPNQKINYDRVMQQMAKVWAKESVRPSILILGSKTGLKIEKNINAILSYFNP